MIGNKATNLISLLKQGFPVPEFDVLDEANLNDYTPSFEADLYSVRSSCSLEDGNNLSFAGQFETFLDVKKDEIKKKAKECFESMTDEKIIKYLGTEKKYSKNVIIQKMITADISGVIFTSNPQGILNETVIVCARGNGENVVQDKGSEVTTYYYNRTDD